MTRCTRSKESTKSENDYSCDNFRIFLVVSPRNEGGNPVLPHRGRVSKRPASPIWVRIRRSQHCEPVQCFLPPTTTAKASAGERSSKIHPKDDKSRAMMRCADRMHTAPILRECALALPLLLVLATGASTCALTGAAVVTWRRLGRSFAFANRASCVALLPLVPAPCWSGHRYGLLTSCPLHVHCTLAKVLTA